jgi:hypothetical protein
MKVISGDFSIKSKSNHLFLVVFLLILHCLESVSPPSQLHPCVVHPTPTVVGTQSNKCRGGAVHYALWSRAFLDEGAKLSIMAAPELESALCPSLQFTLSLV